MNLVRKFLLAFNNIMFFFLGNIFTEKNIVFYFYFLLLKSYCEKNISSFDNQNLKRSL